MWTPTALKGSQTPQNCHNCPVARQEISENGNGRKRQMNRRERMAEIIERDGPYCVWCSAPLNLTLNPPTTEHLVPRIKGGPSWIENELAACKRCNNERGHQSPAGWIHDCEGMGRTPRVDVVIKALERLQTAITERGGIRRARPYIASQLRRLRNR